MVNYSAWENIQVKKRTCNKFRPKKIQVQKWIWKLRPEKINIFKLSVP